MEKEFEYTKFHELLERKKEEYGDKFNDKDLAKKFISYYNNGYKIKVKFGDEIITGRVGITTGWKPVFLLIRTERSIGSSYTLSNRDKIIGIKIGNKYKDFK